MAGDAQIVKIPRSAAMLAALDRVIAVAEETDENAAFEVPIREFWHLFSAECAARGLWADWHPLVVLLLLERALLADESLPVERRVDYAAAVATIRQCIQAHQDEQPSWN
jgi:hypothetical protein